MTQEQAEKLMKALEQITAEVKHIHSALRTINNTLGYIQLKIK